jgi:L-seryl-tRNA(Ser) seleniumtransferase
MKKNQETKGDILRKLPSMTELLNTPEAAAWLREHPRGLVAECLRQAVEQTRKAVHLGKQGNGETEKRGDGEAVLANSQSIGDVEWVLTRASMLLAEAVEPHIRHAINATGIILHTGLGRAVFSALVVDGLVTELKGSVTLATDRRTGERAERDELVEYILTELTGAEAATVVNNNAAATMLALAGLAAQREVIVSRGQLIEIGGSFRLPEVMAQSQAKLVEVGATNRTHLKDYAKAITENTAAIMRVHPSNFRVVGFTSEVPAAELAKLAHERGLIFMDDLGSGALVDLRPFGLPHEPTARESIEAGADLVLFSGDKLIGAGQAGILVGRKSLIDRLRKHPLMRALRADKTCLMILERTLSLFRDTERLRRENPTYRMMSAPMEEVRNRANALASTIRAAAPGTEAEAHESQAFLGSGSLPDEAIPSMVVAVTVPGMSAEELARRLRMDAACVFGRIERDRVLLDARTITDAEVKLVAEAIGRLM